MKKLIIAVVLTACKQVAPPVADGKCLADVYEGTKTPSQVCIWQGYTWKCEYNNRCTRVGEAKGER